MSQIITFGIGGYCEKCDQSHDHPMHNIISIEEIPNEQVIVLEGK